MVCPLFTIYAYLSLRYDCELIPIRVERLNAARFRVTVHAPVIPPEGVTDEHRKVLATPREINSLSEAWITRESPGMALLQGPLAQGCNPALNLVTGCHSDRHPIGSMRRFLTRTPECVYSFLMTILLFCAGTNGELNFTACLFHKGQAIDIALSGEPK